MGSETDIFYDEEVATSLDGSREQDGQDGIDVSSVTSRIDAGKAPW